MSKIRQSSIKWVPFGNVVLFSQYGLSGAAQNKGKYPILRMGNLIDGKISTKNLVYINLPTDYFNKFKLKKSDLLINRTNSADLVGKTALFNLDDNFVCASYLIRFVLNKTIVEPKFINYFFNTESSKVYLKALSTKGVSQSNINPTVLKKRFKIPLLSLSEQKRIVGILSTWDQAIEKLDKLISAKEKQFKWFSNTLLSQEGWPIVRLGDICKIVGGGTPTTLNPNYWNGNIHWITPKDLSNYSDMYISKGCKSLTEEGLRKSSAKIVPQNTVLLSTRAPIGYVAIAENPLSTNQGLRSLILIKKCSPEYIYYILKSKNKLLNSLGSGATFKELSGGTLKDIQISFPPLEVQKGIAVQLKTVGESIRLLKNIKRKYEKQKKGLMQKLLTGKWRIKV